MLRITELLSSTFRDQNYCPRSRTLLCITEKSLSKKAGNVPNEPYCLYFRFGIEMQSNTLYTIEIQRTNGIGDATYHVINGKASVTESDLTISFENASPSDNTDVSRAAIPRLYFLKDL